MQMAIYSSLSGGGSGGDVASDETLIEGVVMLCSWIPRFDCLSPAKADAADAADAADCATCWDIELKDLRNCLPLPALSHIRDNRAQATTNLATRFGRKYLD